MTIQIYSSLLRVCSTEPSGGSGFRPWSELTAATHLHGLVVFRLHGRRVPARFDDFSGFVAEVSEQVVPTMTWGGNLDAFNDILRGGFGTPDGGFVLEWRDASGSRRRLGYEETARRWDDVATRCHPANVASIREHAEAARRREGPTLFDDIVAIIRDHGEGGSESEDGVELRLIE